jgi:hypothetical protein
MSQQSYQEPIEKEDLDLAKKIKENIPVADVEKVPESPESKAPEKPEMPAAEKIPSAEIETGKETAAEQVSEKIETARKTIQTQKPAVPANVATDAQAVSQIAEYEKKVEKLVQIALEKGPVHAVKVAQHLDSSDDYTLDELHDKLIEEGLRKHLFQKGLLREL